MRCRIFGSPTAQLAGTGFSGIGLASAALAVVALLLVGGVTWVALFAALIVPLVMGVAALMRPRPPRPFDASPYSRFDGPIIEGEYRVLPPER